MLGEKPHVTPRAFWSSRWSRCHGLSPYATHRSRARARSRNDVVAPPASTTVTRPDVVSARRAAISAAVMPLPTMRMSVSIVFIV
jgi:hypothetical protein